MSKKTRNPDEPLKMDERIKDFLLPPSQLVQRAWKEGIESGPSVDAETIFTRLKVKYATLQKPDGSG